MLRTKHGKISSSTDRTLFRSFTVLAKKQQLNYFKEIEKLLKERKKNMDDSCKCTRRTFSRFPCFSFFSKGGKHQRHLSLTQV